jgi:phosphoribosylformimino-5-aminoimidazole carboxamide ribotide isomerase
MFTIIPAIDLKDGRCVRLRQGVADDAKVYSEDPVEMAKHWASEGGRYLHVVDLDGAFQGRPVHHDLIRRIIAAVKIPVEVGGGLRTDADIRGILDLGADRAIIGTRALAEPAVLKRLASEFGDKLAVGIDARNGMVQVKGWVETSGMRATDLATMADHMGVRTIIYTDTSRDGMMTGTNVGAVEAICRTVRCNVVASGGVTSAADVQALLNLRKPNLVGAIVGKALYERQTSLKELSALS